MNEWDEKFSQHPVHKGLSTFQVQIDRLINSKSISPTVAGRLARLSYVAKFIEMRLKLLEPALVSQGQLNSVSKQLTNAEAELKLFESDRNEPRLQTANDQVDAALVQAGSAPLPTVPIEVEALVDAIGSFREGAKAALEWIEERRNELSSKYDDSMKKAALADTELGQLRTQIEAQKGRLDQAIAEFQSQFSQAEANRRQAFDAEVKAAKTLTDLSKKAAEEAENQRQSQFAESLISWNGRQEGLISEQTKTLGDLHTYLREQGDSTVKYLGGRKDEATKLVRIIGNVSVTGNFKKVSDDERFLANAYQGIALSLMLGLVVAVVLTIAKALDSDALWHDVLLRLGVAFALVIPAAYTANLAAGHRRFERQNRVLELQLASVDPFLEAFPPEDRNKIKAQLTERFFGRATEELPRDAKLDLPYAKAVEILGQIANKALDKLPGK